MNRIIVALTLPWAPAVSRSAPDDAEANLVKAGRPTSLGASAPPNVGAIPLLDTIPPNVQSRMRVSGPKATGREGAGTQPAWNPDIPVPMPACEPGLFESK